METSDLSLFVPWSLYLEVAINVGGVRRNAPGKDQGGVHSLFAVLGIPVSQGSFAALLLKWGQVLHGQLLGERPPNMEKQAAVFEKAARVRCCACPP